MLSAVFLLMLLFIGGDKQKHFLCFDHKLERNNNGDKRKVIIDCDPGIDDSLAIMLALKSPEDRGAWNHHRLRKLTR